MALVVPQAAAITGTNVTFAAPTTSETITPDPDAVYVVVIGATSTTVTIVVPGLTFGQANPDIPVLTAATNTTRYIGGLGNPALADPATGLITVTFSQVTNVTAALVRN
ncbi:MAG: hypothetical protein ACRD0W_01085 [Acidimicrobiales bacterium]